VITLSVRGTSDERRTARKKKAVTDLCQFAPLDPDALLDHTLGEAEARRRAPSLGVIRLYCAMISEQAEILKSLRSSEKQRLGAWAWLSSNEIKHLWYWLEAVGADLFPYERFRATVDGEMSRGLE
jgi:hypothetical protein